MNETQPDPHRHILAGMRIGIFGKGGSGKSTVVVLLANAFQNRGYEVCVLDADSTNIGLAHALGIEYSPKPLMAYFGGMVFSGGRVTCPVDDPTTLANNEISLDELPKQFYGQSGLGITHLIAGKISDLGPGAGCDGPVSKIARDIRFSKPGKAVLTLVDFKAGFEEVARGVITSLDWAIVIVDPTKAAVEMAVDMKNTIYQIKEGKLPATRHLESLDLVAIANNQFMTARIKGAFYLLNKIVNLEMESYLRERLMEYDLEPSGVIHEDPSISTAWLLGKPLVVIQPQAEIVRVIEKLENAEIQSSRSQA